MGDLMCSMDSIDIYSKRVWIPSHPKIQGSKSFIQLIAQISSNCAWGYYHILGYPSAS